MQKELDQENTDISIQILGLNRSDRASGNGDITVGRDLPWLQDTDSDDVWSLWTHEYRDVVVLNEKNERVGVFGRTDKSIGVSENYPELKQMFLDAANK